MATANLPRVTFGKLSDSQIAFLESTPWHLEALPGAEYRLRVVYPDLKAKGRWFSRDWPVVGWEFIRPQ